MNKKWTLFEKLFITLSILTIIICFIFTKDKSYLSLVVSIFGLITVFMGAKGYISAPILNIIYSVLYISVSVKNAYYGEVIIYLSVMIPLNAFTIYTWITNKNENDKSKVKPNKLNMKEFIILLIVALLSSIIFYFILKLLNTESIYVSTFSLTTLLIASYLYFRRSSKYALAYMIHDIVLIYLWGLTLKNDYTNLPLIITFIVFLFNDTYGYLNWKKMEKEK